MLTQTYQEHSDENRQVQFSFCRRRAGRALFVVLFSSWSVAQTCVAGIQASSPTSVYVVDSVNGTVIDSRAGLMWDRCARGLSGVGCATGASSSFTWQSALYALGVAQSRGGVSDQSQHQ